jgi:DNA repair protein RadC
MYALAASQTYIIHDRPVPEDIAQRLSQEGAESLSAHQLLEVLLGPDTAEQIQLAEYGSGILSTLEQVSDIQRLWPLNDEKARELLAALSLGRRLFSPTSGSFVTIRGIDDVWRAYSSMNSLPKEQLRLLLINSRYQLVHEEILAVGQLDDLSIRPRDVFQPAVERRVAAILLVHNHPSGDPTPSQSDRDFTKVIQDAGELLGIELLDHVIIGHDRAESSMPVVDPPGK